MSVLVCWQAGVSKTGLMWRSWIICLMLLASLSLTLADDVTSQMFGDVTDGLPAAFGDFNSDELTDMFVIRDDARTLEILLGQDKEPSLQPKGLKCKFDSATITSVVPGDFNGDALMDVMVTLLRSNDNSYQHVVMLWGEMNKINCTQDSLFRTVGQPLAIDYNKDMVMDLFGVNENHTRSFWLFDESQGVNMIEMPEYTNFTSPIRVPHSHAFLELTDDDVTDLYITTDNNFEIWKGNEDAGFSPLKIIPFPDGVSKSKQVGQTVFLDVELQGKLDHLVPVCFDPSCSDSKIFVYSNNSWHDLHVDFKEPGTGDTWHFPTGSSYPYINTITLRPGDFNMDGYPDLLATLVSGKNPQITKSLFFENVPCKTSCSEFKRTFEVQWTMLSSYNNNTILGVFYDFLQDGVLDIIFVHNKGSMYVSAYRNTENYDANFVKVMVVTGLTNPKHPLIVGPLRKSASVYGTNLPGPKIFYETTTQDGDPRAAVATQIPQSAHFSLNLPYTIFGLGRTPNFIDSLTVKVYGKDRQWTQLIPNSQMVVIPWPVEDPYGWKVQLFVTPSKLIVQSVIALSATCIVILAIIGVLYWKERKEDHLEKLQEAHRFHFDAM